MIRKTRGGTWPTGPVTEEENYGQLEHHRGRGPPEPVEVSDA